MIDRDKYNFVYCINFLKSAYVKCISRKIYIIYDRTKTDTGRWVENTKALEITILKELGKLHP